MSNRLFDTHCHLDLPELGINALAVARHALQQGVSHLLVPAISPTRWQLQIELKQFLASQLPQCHVYLAFGVHPWWHHDVTSDTWCELEQLLQQHRQAPVGECGLDFALDWLAESERAQERQRQTTVFRSQVELAQLYGKPLIVHHRKSQSELLAVLKQCRFTHGGILHAFSGSQAQAKAFLDLGFKLGIGGTISYPRAEKTRHTVAKLPLDALVLETDAPSMPLFGFQGHSNQPAQTKAVFDCLCQLRPEAPEQIAQQLWRTSLSVLKLS